MPFPLPHFKNKPDPLLPSDDKIKPFLYNLDDYQTYDVCWCQVNYRWFYIKFIWQHLYNQLPLCVPEVMESGYDTPQPYPAYERGDLFAMKASEIKACVLFDRFTPWDYPWAEDYSTKFFNFIKKYCLALTGRLSSSDNLIKRDFDNLIPRANNKPNFKYTHKLGAFPPYKFIFKCNTDEQQTVAITWIENVRDSNNCETIKRHRLFSLSKGENIIQLNFEYHICACSIVVTENESKVVEKAIEAKEPGLLYKNVDKLFEEINRFCVGLPIQYGTGTFGDEYGRGLDFKPLPDWYYFSSLLYANNNYWKNKVNIDISKDLGKPIYATTLYNGQEIEDVVFVCWGDGSLCVAGNTPGLYAYLWYGEGEAVFAPDNRMQQSQNLYKDHQFPAYTATISEPANYWRTRVIPFTQGEQESINEHLEETLIRMNLALNKEMCISFIDQRKKAELQE